MMSISGLNHTPRSLAVYASQCRLPEHHARLASGRWPGSAGRGWLPAGFQRKVSAYGFPLSQAFLAHSLLDSTRLLREGREGPRRRSPLRGIPMSKGREKERKRPSSRESEAAPRQPEHGDSIEFEVLIPGPPSWSRLWEPFIEKNRNWWDRVCKDGPVYTL